MEPRRPLQRIDLDEVAQILRDAGAIFAYLHDAREAVAKREDG